MLNKEKILKEIGERIKILRTQQKLSLIEFSYIAEIDRSNLFRIEKGQASPNIATYIKIAVALDVPLREIMP